MQYVLLLQAKMVMRMSLNITFYIYMYIYTHTYIQNVLRVLFFHLRDPKIFYFIFQNSNVLIISRFQWLHRLKDESRKMFDIVSIKYLFLFRFFWGGGGV
jgi:hypothetical protein